MLCDELKKLKTESRMTAKQIADASGVPESTVNRILSGETECPSFQAVCDIVKSMHGSLDDIAGIPRKVSAPMDDDYRKQLLSDISLKDRWIRSLYLFLATVLIVSLFCVFHNFLIGG